MQPWRVHERMYYTRETLKNQVKSPKWLSSPSSSLPSLPVFPRNLPQLALTLLIDRDARSPQYFRAASVQRMYVCTASARRRASSQEGEGEEERERERERERCASASGRAPRPCVTRVIGFQLDFKGRRSPSSRRHTAGARERARGRAEASENYTRASEREKGDDVV